MQYITYQQFLYKLDQYNDRRNLYIEIFYRLVLRLCIPIKLFSLKRNPIFRLLNVLCSDILRFADPRLKNTVRVNPSKLV
jgi:hypothetical protein